MLYLTKVMIAAAALFLYVNFGLIVGAIAGDLPESESMRVNFSTDKGDGSLELRFVEAGEVEKRSQVSNFKQKLIPFMNHMNPKYYKTVFVVARLVTSWQGTQVSVLKLSADANGWGALVPSAATALMSGSLQALNGPFLKWLDTNGRLERWLRKCKVSKKILEKLDARSRPGLSRFLINEVEGLAKILVLIEIPFVGILKAVMMSMGIDRTESISSAVLNVILTSVAALYFQAPLEKAIASDRAWAIKKDPQIAGIANFLSDSGVLLVSYATTALSTAAMLESPFAAPALLLTGSMGLVYYYKSAVSRFAQCRVALESENANLR